MSTIELDDDLELDDDQHETPLVQKLRKQIKDQAKRIKELEPFEAENKALKLDGLIGKADLSDLKDAQRETLADWASKQDDVTPDVIRDRAVALGWAEAKPDPADEDIDAHERISAATSTARPKGAHQITPEDAAAWPADKRMRFRREHPSEYETLMRGEAVAGVTF